ncbi:hypothetical protein LSTR_LSTR012056 [Laodelphax striatellus]|uniref:Ribonuclease P protein subunit p20 n=1 Tax=Laodelphax striatellus TaxID=195883 RepID=A0A482WQM4_LAOST|nr:hypothetical protein LSTR_LSTR012056 [Laodelphax striatellus]
MAQEKPELNILSNDISTAQNKFEKKRYQKILPRHNIRKRCPPQGTRRNNDVYVTSSSNFKSQLGQCRKLIEEGEQEIVIHGLGAALPQAINLALQLQDLSHNTWCVSTGTDTVDVVDDLEPLSDDVDFDTRVRPNSCIHIKLVKKP